MKKSFKNILNELNTINGQLSEAYIFNGDDGRMGDEMARMEPNEMENNSSEEEIAMHANEVIQHEPIIGKIRETAIEGLRKYADHPTSEIYNFFKKVFLESDKVLTDSGEKK